MKTDYLANPIAARLAAYRKFKTGTTFASEPPWKRVSYSSRWGGEPWEISRSSLHARWHEAPANVFRLVGDAHEVCRSIKHTGWFLDEFQDETTHGLVFRLTHGRGFLAAGSDPNNEGSAYIETHANGQPYVYDTAENAATSADLLAERYAEAECEYQEKAREELRQEDERRARAEREEAEREEAEQLTEAFAFPC